MARIGRCVWIQRRAPSSASSSAPSISILIKVGSAERGHQSECSSPRRCRRSQAERHRRRPPEIAEPYLAPTATFSGLILEATGLSSVPIHVPKTGEILRDRLNRDNSGESRISADHLFSRVSCVGTAVHKVDLKIEHY